jgi:hypothetical protein
MKRTLLAQGLYYTVTGLWPFVHLRSFVAITGPKHDYWLVRTVGALAAAIGVTLVRAAVRERPSDDARTLAATSALAFGGCDTFYAGIGRISPVYLADAAVQAGFVALSSRR